jgi:hypothetical protein
MKSELTTLQPKRNEFPKLMRHREHGAIIAATHQEDNSITGICVWVREKDSNKLLAYSENWSAELFTDLPRNECVILSNP